MAWRCSPHVDCFACQVLRDLLELFGASAHSLLCSGLRGAPDWGSLSQASHDCHRQAANVPAEGAEAHTKVSVLACQADMRIISLRVPQGIGHEHGARGQQRARRARIQHAVAGVVPIPAAGALRGEPMTRRPVRMCASFRFVLCQALPMKKCAPNSAHADRAQSIIWRDGDEICVRLLRRKNLPRGSGTMRRKCSCAAGVRTCCAVHTLWERFFALLPDGTCPWAAVSPSLAIARLRRLLQVLGVPDVNAYGTHGFRRGHAEVGRFGPCACKNRCTCICLSHRTCVSVGIHWPRSLRQASGEAPPSSNT